MALMTPKIKGFVESNISNEFGLTVDQVANSCKSYGRFSSWLGSDITRIKEVLNVVKANGVSPSFFASYEKTEGYNSKWGWLNHTSIKGTPVQDADSVAKWIVSQSKNTTDKPAWIDFANYKDFVPTSVKAEGNAHFSTLPSGRIGKVVIAGTSAATWEVYYPLGLKKEYNGTQNYGAPLNSMIDTIVSWGGKISGGGTSGVQLAQFPMDRIYITQGERGSFSHSTNWAIDLVGTHTKYPYYAPCDVTLVKKITSEALLEWTTDNPVMCADGIIRKFSFWCIHEVGNPFTVGKKLKKGEHMGRTGIGAFATGDHLHLEVGQVGAVRSKPLHTYDIFAVNGVDIVNGYGYNWRTSDHEDGSGGTIDPDDPDIVDSESSLIHLYLCGALRNWL